MNFNVMDGITHTVEGPDGKKIVSNGGHPQALSKVIKECERLMFSIK